MTLESPHQPTADDPPLPADHPDAPAPPELAPPPRAITRAIRGKSLGEKHVRGWLLLFVSIAIIMAGLAATELYRWFHEQKLISEGIQVMARIENDDEAIPVVKGHPIHVDSVIAMVYEIKGQRYRVKGPLRGYDKDLKFTNAFDTPIRVDPANPTVWTSRLTPLPLWRALMGAMMLAPIAGVLLAGIWWNRRQVLRTYRDGELIAAEVVGIKQAALGPGSKVIRCVIADGRILTTMVPSRRAPTAIGDLIWLLALPTREHKAVPAALFE